MTPIEMPADCPQPADHGPSYYLTLPCRPYAVAVRDISRYRDLPDYVWDELRHHRHTAQVIVLAERRVK